MTKLQLPNVTLVCIDGRQDNSSSVKAVNHCLKLCDFGDVFFYPGKDINSEEAYSAFILKELHLYIKTHALIIQNDGYILNPKAWEDVFLTYDYIGAPWDLYPAHQWPGFDNVTSKNCVGNGGFSLRSKSLLKATSEIFTASNPKIYHPEDAWICRNQRDQLEKGYYLKFAPLEVASKFSVENTVYSGQFGFHGKLTALINKFSI